MFGFTLNLGQKNKNSLWVGEGEARHENFNFSCVPIIIKMPWLATTEDMKIKPMHESLDFIRRKDIDH